MQVIFSEVFLRGFLSSVSIQMKATGKRALCNNLTLNVCFVELLELAYINSRNTCACNVTGHPALSINAGFSEGLPVGMMIVGRKFDEATVLNVAYAYEKIRDTTN